MDEINQQVLDLIQKYGYTEDDFDTDQLAEMYLGLKNGLSKDQVWVYMVPSLTADQMLICRQYGEKRIYYRPAATDIFWGKKWTNGRPGVSVCGQKI